MPYLTLTTTAGALLKQWEFRNRPVTIGRGEQADIRMDDGEMSRLHFTITPAGAGYVLSEKSSNGTWVNDQPVQAPVSLKSGDQIRAGMSQFLFEETHEPATGAWLARVLVPKKPG